MFPSSARALELLIQRRAEEDKMQISRILFQQRQLAQLPRMDLSNSLSLAMARRAQEQQVLQQPRPLLALPTASTPVESVRSPSPSQKLSPSTSEGPMPAAATLPAEDAHDSDSEEFHLMSKYRENREDDDAFFHKHRDPKESFARSEPFPFKIYRMLHETLKNQEDHIVSWSPRGDSFIIHDTDKFVETVMPRYFTSHRMTSFQRQLNLYGFRRRLRGDDKGSYWHKDFIKTERNRCLSIKRKIQKLKIPPHFLKQKPAPLVRERSALPNNNNNNNSASAALLHTSVPKPGYGTMSSNYSAPDIAATTGGSPWGMLSLDARLAAASRTAMLKQRLAMSNYHKELGR